MKKAWVENERIRDICYGNPDECYHPDIAKHYIVDVPDDAENGDGWLGGQLIKPEPPAPVLPQEPMPPKVSPVEFMLLFSSAERVAIRATRKTDPVIDDFLDIIEDTRLTLVDLALNSTAEALDYMISIGLLVAERKPEILTGKPL